MHLQSEYYQQLQFGVESYEDRWDKKVTEALLIHYIDMWNVPSKGSSMRGIIEKQSAKTLFLPSMYLNVGEKSSRKIFQRSTRCGFRV